MQVHLYALVWNERPMLPFFFEHYRPFVDRFFLFDDGSDDGSVEYCRSQPAVTLVPFATRRGDSFVDRAREFYGYCWKASRGKAAWVLIVNIDEFLHTERPRHALERARGLGATAVASRGFDMVSDEFPSRGPLTNQVTLGVRKPQFDKLAAFDPNAIDDINYGPGRHLAHPTGRVRWADDLRFDLLHFKHLGERYLIDRYRALGARLGQRDRINGWGYQYHLDPPAIADRFARLRAAARPILTTHARAQGLVEELLAGCWLVRLRDHDGERGALQEIWDDGKWSAPVAHTYLTRTQPGVIRAWYRHRGQTDQLTVVAGRIRLVLYDSRPGGDDPGPVTVDLDATTSGRVTIAPGVWHGFCAIGAEEASVLHLNDRAYDFTDTDEERLPHDTDRIPYRWDPESS